MWERPVPPILRPSEYSDRRNSLTPECPPIVPDGPESAMTSYDEQLPLSPLSMAILLALADGERHGYALMQEVEEQTHGALRPGTGSLYAGLQRLQADGLIRESEGEPGADRRRRYYAITAEGRAMARAEAERMLRVLGIAVEKRLAPEMRPAES